MQQNQHQEDMQVSITNTQKSRKESWLGIDTIFYIVIKNTHKKSTGGGVELLEILSRVPE